MVNDGPKCGSQKLIRLYKHDEIPTIGIDVWAKQLHSWFRHDICRNVNLVNSVLLSTDCRVFVTIELKLKFVLCVIVGTIV